MVKKIITYSSCFLLITLMTLSLYALSMLSRHRDFDRDIVMGLYAEKKKSLDMIYIGSSSCYRYWQPLTAWEEEGFTSYDFGTSALAPQVIKYYIEEVRKTQKPSLYVIDVRPFQYGDEPAPYGATFMHSEPVIRRSTGSFNYSINQINMINTCVKDPTERLSYYFDFIKYHSNVDQAFDDVASFLKGENQDLIDYTTNKKTHHYKGHLIAGKISPEPLVFQDFSSIKEETPLPDELNTIYLDLLRYIKKLNVPTLFIVCPYIQQESHKMRYNYMARIANENGIGFLNVHDEYEKTLIDFESDLYDENHVNVVGAEKYTKYLVNYLKEHYDLPDKRTNDSYISWNKDLAQFKTDVEVAKEAIANGATQ